MIDVGDYGNVRFLAERARNYALLQLIRSGSHSLPGARSLRDVPSPGPENSSSVSKRNLQTANNNSSRIEHALVSEISNLARLRIKPTKVLGVGPRFAGFGTAFLLMCSVAESLWRSVCERCVVYPLVLFIGSSPTGSRETLARRVQTGNWSYRIGMNIARVYCRAGMNDEARVYPLRVLEFSPDLHSHDLTKTIGSKTRPFPHQAGEVRFLRPRSKARMTSIL